MIFSEGTEKCALEKKVYRMQTACSRTSRAGAWPRAAGPLLTLTDDYVCTNRHGSRLRLHNMESRWEKARAMVGVRMPMYAMRHIAPRACLRPGPTLQVSRHNPATAMSPRLPSTTHTRGWRRRKRRPDPCQHHHWCALVRVLKEKINKYA